MDYMPSTSAVSDFLKLYDYFSPEGRQRRQLAPQQEAEQLRGARNQNDAFWSDLIPMQWEDTGSRRINANAAATGAGASMLNAQTNSAHVPVEEAQQWEALSHTDPNDPAVLRQHMVGDLPYFMMMGGVDDKTKSTMSNNYLNGLFPGLSDQVKAAQLEDSYQKAKRLHQLGQDGLLTSEQQNLLVSHGDLPAPNAFSKYFQHPAGHTAKPQPQQQQSDGGSIWDGVRRLIGLPVQVPAAAVKAQPVNPTASKPSADSEVPLPQADVNSAVNSVMDQNDSGLFPQSMNDVATAQANKPRKGKSTKFDGGRSMVR